MSYLFENNKDHQFSQNLKILALQATRILNWYPPTPDCSGAKRSWLVSEVEPTRNGAGLSLRNHEKLDSRKKIRFVPKSPIPNS